MSAEVEQIDQPEFVKWINYAHDIADGIVPINPNVLERVAHIQHFTSSFRLELAEKHIRNTFRILLVALNGPSRRSIIEFFGRAYEVEHRKT